MRFPIVKGPLRCKRLRQGAVLPDIAEVSEVRVRHARTSLRSRSGFPPLPGSSAFAWASVLSRERLLARPFFWRKEGNAGPTSPQPHRGSAGRRRPCRVLRLGGGCAVADGLSYRRYFDGGGWDDVDLESPDESRTPAKTRVRPRFTMKAGVEMVRALSRLPGPTAASTGTWAFVGFEFQPQAAEEYGPVAS